MSLDSIYIKGYRSIQEAKIPLGAINVLIGANGSGKSNLLSFFEPQEVIAVDRIDGASQFQQLEEEALASWLEQLTALSPW